VTIVHALIDSLEPTPDAILDIVDPDASLASAHPRFCQLAVLLNLQVHANLA
jgi:hypothetical protein